MKKLLSERSGGMNFFSPLNEVIGMNNKNV